ncbi:MAG: XRE family transcriptional regulator, partial [Kaistella sp.]|nr:XRE family transcriptional regulator [Kaistella sp.]
LIKGEGEMKKSEEEELVPEKVKPTSIPDLFSLINDENFGVTESEDKVQKSVSRESEIPQTYALKENTGDSQRLATLQSTINTQPVENQENKIKRIIWFYENGKYESFEP